MLWYHFLMDFFGGAFAANFVPHFVSGISGRPFPSPFAKPPGRGLSPPTTNVLWGLVNMVIACLLLHGGLFSADKLPAAGTAFAGFAAMGLMLSKAFSTPRS